MISTGRSYRYYLTRSWRPDADSNRALGFIMLNPSTANDTDDDPTIRRCMGFARRDGFNGIAVANLYPLRATDPVRLSHASEAVRLGPESDADKSIGMLWPTCGIIVVAWGAHGARFPSRVQHVLDLLEGVPLYHLGKTKSGEPRHPLYVGSWTKLERL